MRISAKLIVLVLVVGLAGISGNAGADDFPKTGTVGSQFLKIPVGARGAAMGQAFGSMSDDVTSPFWNPAGLTHVENTQVMLERIEWLADIGYSAIAVAHHLQGVGTVGFFATSLNSGEMEETTVEYPEGTGRMFEVTNLLVGASYGFRITDKFAFGANIKYVRENLDDDIANAWAIDIGSSYDTGWKTVKLNFALRNFGPEIQLDGSYHDYNNGVQLEDATEFLPYHFPMVFRIGAAFDPVRSNIHRLSLAGELEHPNDNLERVNLGGEYAFHELFFLRGGYTFNHDTLGMSAGMGAMWKNFGVDYAFSDYQLLDQVHWFTVKFNY